MNENPPERAPDFSPSPSARRARWPLWVAVAVVLAAGAAWFEHRRAAADDTAAAADPGAGKGAGQGAQGGAGAQGGGGRGKGGRFGGPTPVAVAPVVKQDIRVIETALGTVTPLATVNVLPQAGGQIVEVAFQEGQSVHKGDLLIQIDPRPYQAALDQAQGQLAKDQAALEEARMDLQRYQDLLVKKSIMRQQAEDQKWVVQQDEGAVRVDQAAVDTARINLGYCRIVSPTDGRVGLRQVDPGNVVQAGSTTALAVITRMQPMTVVFALPEDDLPRVLGRQHAGVRLPVDVYDRSGSTRLDSGVLLAVDSQINTSTGTVNLKAQFPNAGGVLFPNQFVNVNLHIDELKGAAAMPSAAVQRGAKGTYVYTVKADNTVSVAQVQLGASDGGNVAVLSGLSVGDRVVIDGADKLRDGASVTVSQE